MPKSKKGKSKNGGKASQSRKGKQQPVAGRNPRIRENPLKMQPALKQFHGAKGTGLSACAELYAKALINPWGEFTELPCVPCTPPDMTQRYRIIQRGSFSTGTQGCGFVSWSPLMAPNNLVAVSSTLPTFTGTTFVSDTVLAGTGTTAPKGALPYSSGSFNTPGNCIGARLVGSGMRITNTTAPLYRQGSILAARMMTGTPLYNFAAGNLQGNLENIKNSANADQEWFYWNWIPQDEEDYDYPDGAYNYQVDVAGNRGAKNFGFLVSGANTTNVSTFDWELIEFWEFSGGSSSAQLPNLTKSHADAVGFSRVLEAVSVPRQSLDLKDAAHAYSQSMVESMAHSDSAAKTVEDLLGLTGLPAGIVSSLAGSLAKMLLQ